MSEGPRDPLRAAIGRIVSRVAADPDLRLALRSLAEVILEATGPPAEGRGDRAEGRDRSEVVAATPEAAPAEGPTTPARPLPPLTLGQGPPPSARLPAYEGQGEGGDRDDRELEEVPARCRLKAEAVRWLVERARRSDRGDDFEALAERDRELVERARALPNCLLWVNLHHADRVGSDTGFAERLAAAYDAVGQSASLLLLLDEGPHDRSQAEAILAAIAEAQSILRVLVARLGERPDVDQTALYQGVRRAAERLGIYIRRYMRLDDPADPARLPALADRLLKLSVRFTATRRVSREQQKLLGKIRHRAGQIAEGAGVEAWGRLVEVVDELVASGMPPSATEIRDLLLPVLDRLPDAVRVTDRFELVVREIDRYLGSRPSPAPPTDPGDLAPIPEVVEVAELLRGRSVVFIANVANPEAREALIRAFELADVDWIVAREHQPIAPFEPHIARPEVALVLLPIRWSSHSFGDIKQFCDRHGKLLVRLPTGYNPNQVAVQVLAQASDRLRLSGRADGDEREEAGR